MTHVIFRTDGSEKIGGGHVGRCLALAETLKSRGAKIDFWCSSNATLGINMIRQAGFSIQRKEKITSIPDWFVVDHYDLGAEWEERVRRTAKILVIDDLANRQHCCDILLDPGRSPDAMEVYDDLIPKKTLRLAGPTYALLRKEFLSSEKCPTTHPHPKILIFFGSVDRAGLTEQTLKALQNVEEQIEIHAVITSANPRHTEISAFEGVTVHQDIPNMAKLLCRMNLAIGAGGVALWERCCLGLPGIAVALNENQRPALESAEAAGAVKRLHRENFSADFMPTFTSLLKDMSKQNAMSKAARNLIDGHGATRVAEAMGQ
jgi:UDP-2,4-diacetamido-2,4,6-trideoxy-beta-L-altropyranose hydrolase